MRLWSTASRIADGATVAPMLTFTCQMTLLGGVRATSTSMSDLSYRRSNRRGISQPQLEMRLLVVVQFDLFSLA